MIRWYRQAFEGGSVDVIGACCADDPADDRSVRTCGLVQKGFAELIVGKRNSLRRARPTAPVLHFDWNLRPRHPFLDLFQIFCQDHRLLG